uniref:Stress-induced-phosphoprotein 1-like n=1 Tax=Phallusia mammillata TaxID=59560 RepID=A0A6F9DUU3_9ASCI|nr:stress-induced-phosphoprotein 1-like [Phallusia mammillata]
MADKVSTVASIKAKGNALMKEGKYVEAIIQYSEGISMEPANPVLYSNRSLAFLKVDQHFFAVKDAETTIRLIPDWPKGHYRKGQAEISAEMYHVAIKSFDAGLKSCPNDEILKQALFDAKLKHEQYLNWKRWTLKKYAIIAGIIGSLLIIGDMLWESEYAFITRPWLRGLVVSCSAAFGYVLASLVLSIHRSTKASLLQPPPELMQGTDLDYNPMNSKQKSTESESTSVYGDSSSSSSRTKSE